MCEQKTLEMRQWAVLHIDTTDEAAPSVYWAQAFSIRNRGLVLKSEIVSWGILDRELILENSRFYLTHFRDIRNITVGTLSQQITNQLMSLKGLHSHLQDIQNYLEQVVAKKLPINHGIVYQLQDVFNLIPNLNVDEFIKSFVVKTNDQMLVVYVASMIRSIIALHNLINNKLQNKDFEKEETKGKDKDSKDKKEKEKVKEEKEAKEAKDSNKK